MRWAAWADALGFISELTSESGLRRRLRGRPLSEPLEWTRRVGGKFGVDVTLPSGCYSDDTQLRLATARAIHGRGFDVEAFARIELTVWPTYALGGGRSSKAAAANMSKPSTPWFGNFYTGWLDAGGNGVAMRIQPHVWAAAQPAVIGPHILDVIVNGTVSHGHPRALVGAVLHALALGATLNEGRVPSTGQWPDLLNATEQAVKVIDEHSQLTSLWRPAWENKTKTSFNEQWLLTVNECRQMLAPATLAVERIITAGDFNSPAARGAYGELIAALDLRQPAKRGMATATVIVALALAAAAPSNPAGAARLAAQMLDTDTDTIATMAGAIIGASDDSPEPPSVLDQEYLTSEAIRLAEIANGQDTTPFGYPDLLNWTPPRTQLDAVGKAGERVALAGLGWLDEREGTEPAVAQGAEWIWTTSDFGATFLVKRRGVLRDLPASNWPIRRDHTIPARPEGEQTAAEGEHATTGELFPIRSNGNAYTSEGSGRATPSGDVRDSDRINRAEPNIDQMLDWLTRNKFADELIGYAIKRTAEVGTADQFSVFSAALRAELRKRKVSAPPPPSRMTIRRRRADRLLIEIERAHDWNEKPVLFWQSLPRENLSLLPGLHDPSGIRGALQNYRPIRSEGFNFTRLRSKFVTIDGGIRIEDDLTVFDVRPDGFVTAAAVATEEMLGWGTADSTPGRLNVIALSETTLEYYRLMQKIAMVSPHGRWQHRIVAVRFGGKEPRQLWPGWNAAFAPQGPSPTISIEKWEQDWRALNEPERDAYQALADTYALFGLSVSSNPYVTENRLDSSKIAAPEHPENRSWHKVRETLGQMSSETRSRLGLQQPPKFDNTNGD